MGTRLVASVATTDIYPTTRHTIGFPRELGLRDPELMPWARVLVIEETDDGVLLDRYTQDGRRAGDTWHTNVEEAIAQAEGEYRGHRVLPAGGLKGARPRCCVHGTA
jgi:hypothetical protein